VSLVHETVAANGLKFHVARAGDGPLMLFLHGFPEYWAMWRPMLEHFGARGWCAAAPDLRGYNLSEKPAAVEAYRAKHLMADARRPPGAVDPAAGTTTLGRRMFSRGLQTIGWKAEDPDADRLQYSVHYRREGEDTWRLLRDQLTDTLFVWDTTSVPDGRYLVRVTASDAASNTPDRIMTGDREGGAIDVDNTPPVIASTITGVRVVIRVTDAQSGVHRVDYSLGGQSWQALRAVDGLADSREEQFELTLPSAADAARLVIRATDVMQNVTSAVAGGR
jgi:hypothetical protein